MDNEKKIETDRILDKLMRPEYYMTVDDNCAYCYETEFGSVSIGRFSDKTKDGQMTSK